MSLPYITGAGNTAFGRHEGRDALQLMAEAAQKALDDAGLVHGDVDGVLCGYATTLPHLMLSTLFCERFGLRPAYAHAMQLGGATGAAMLMLAGDLVRSGRCRQVLVVAGENRLSGQTRDSSIQTLAQVGDATHEVPNGASVPAYYALLASRYMHETGTREEDLAQLAVLMRANAARHPDAHLRTAITQDPSRWPLRSSCSIAARSPTVPWRWWSRPTRPPARASRSAAQGRRTCTST